MTPLVRGAVVAVLSLIACATPATAAVPSNADWYEFYIPDSMPYPVGEPKLHADLLVPKGTDLTETKLPIMVSVGP